MPLVALIQKNARMQLRASLSPAVTATATSEFVSQNPMLVSAGKMMTRVAVPLMVWEIVKDTV